MRDMNMPPAGLARQVWSVAGLVHAVADTLAARFGACTVRGELAAFSRAASGHCYFSLQDESGTALLRCAMFRRAAALLDFDPMEGQLVEVRGRVAVYEPRGDLQFVVESMRSAGAGALYEQFLRLKAKLEAQGLFDAGRKRELPKYPRRLGVVTSLGAAALHDVVTALARRAPQVEVVVYPSAVQGAEAPGQLVAALTLAGRRAEVDALILCRGGGSLEDLWAFNDERVVRAVAASPLPVVCGVGHETDVTLADLAADVRAPTPTAAAELAAPVCADCEAQLQALARRLRERLRRQLDVSGQRLDHAALRMARPAQTLLRHRQALALLRQRWRAGTVRWRETRERGLTGQAERLQRAAVMAQLLRRQRLDSLGDRLSALDPKRVLQRGYAWLSDTHGHAITSAQQVQAGQGVTAALADGRIEAQVTRVEPGER
jgi:exodeoxyribonuclease VII large subunit